MTGVQTCALPISRILGARKISIEAMLQKESEVSDDSASVIILTHRVIEKNMNAAITEIEALATIQGEVTRIRIEQLNKEWD